MNTVKRFSKPKTPALAASSVPELAPVFEVTIETPAPDMTVVAEVLNQVIDRPAVVPEINVAAPEVTVNMPEHKCKLKKWDIEFRRNNMGITGATLTELPNDG